jgi:UDP-N-acetyl-D-glucosamine dehydrogenase
MTALRNASGPDGAPAQAANPASSGGDRRVAVVGLGYVGLPLALAFAEAGLEVEGIDSSATRVAEINAGHSPIDDVTDERLQAALDGLLRVHASADADPGAADVVFVCVPTPITATKDPDLGPVEGAAAYLAEHLRRGQLIVLQSTTFPGTTTGPFRVALERSGLQAGRDFDLAFAPERVSPGDPGSAGRRVPRLIGGSTPEATQRGARLLQHINDTVLELSSPDAAELAKLLENVFRNVNIALVNNLALLCERMSLDVWEVIDAAATKPFGFMRFTPGPGVGGHCIPVDPYYLSWRAREFDFIDRFVELAGDINLAMPRHVVDLVGEALNERGRALRGAKVGIVGVAFKPNVQDARNSPAAAVIAGLLERGAAVRFHDPHIATFKDANGTAHDGVELADLLDWSDVIVVLTAHAAIDWAGLFAGAGLVVDTVNSSAGHAVAGRQVLRLGAGWS